jgi:hypothetical protein
LEAISGPLEDHRKLRGGSWGQLLRPGQGGGRLHRDGEQRHSQLTYLDRNPDIGTGYRAAPQVFYFAPKRLWYLVYQTGLPSHSTSTDPGNPQSWSAPKTFQNAAPSGTLDYWTICDSVKCYLFSADDNGHVYRSETTVGEFPGGFRNAQLVLQDCVPSAGMAARTIWFFGLGG